MAIRTGIVIIAKNIKLDRSYKNVLDYTESEMLSLVNSKKVAQSNDCSFIKVGDNVIDTNFSYDDALKCNYMALQNPYYSNKWFFAFIDKVEYISNGNARIHYTVDEYSTWHDYWTSKACFVIREHVNDDSYGKHTIPEDLETGEYISAYSSDFGNFGESHIVMGTTISPVDGTTKVGGGIYGGIYSGIKYYIFEDNQSLNTAITRIASSGNSDSIVSLFYCPDWITGYDDATFTSGIAEVPSTTTATRGGGIAIPLRPNVLGNYTPKNKKLFTYPYCAYIISNNSGGAVEYHIEDFFNTGDNVGSVDIYGTCCPGASIRLIPENYKVRNTTTNVDHSNEYGLNAGKYPIASFPNDTYTNWLTQNSVNMALGTVGTIGSIVGGTALLATGGGALTGAGMIAGGVMGIGNQMLTKYNHSFNPIKADGNVNAGDVTYSTGRLAFSGYFMTIKEEYAKSIDNYFSRFGYKVNTIKIPNESGRHYWNYVQIGAEEDIGYSTNALRSVPSTSMEIINNIYRVGVSIWHSHDQLGNYDLNNNII